MTTKEIENLPVIYEDYPPREPGDFVCTSFFYLRTTSLEKLHFHSAMEIGRCITGSGYCCINNQLQPFSAGDIHIILPYQPHYNIAASESTDCLWHFTSFELLKVTSENLKIDPQFIVSLINGKMTASGIFTPKGNPELVAVVNDIINESLTPASEYRAELLSADIVRLLIRLSRLSSERKTPVNILSTGYLEMILPSLSYVSNTIFRRGVPTVHGMAEACNMSESYFRKVFQELIGSAPKNYIDRALVSRAAQKLISTDLPISEIIETLGITEPSTFYRKFVRYYEMSPNDYRKMHRSADRKPRI